MSTIYSVLGFINVLENFSAKICQNYVFNTIVLELSLG